MTYHDVGFLMRINKKPTYAQGKMGGKFVKLLKIYYVPINCCKRNKETWNPKITIY